jgi:hypothetical protein
MKIKWRVIRERWGPLIYGIALGILVAAVYRLLIGDPNFATGTMAFGTLILALVTFYSTIASNTREKNRLAEESRIRQEERERDFKRRVLADIQNWAGQGIETLANMLYTDGRNWTVEVYPQLKSLSAQNKWMMDASRIFAEDDKKALVKKVDEVAEELKQFCQVLEGKLPVSDIIQRRDRCLKSFTEVLERVADVKVKLHL